MRNSINKDKKECKGCATISHCHMPPNYIIDNIISECPCVTCLIKPICIRGCEPVNDYGDSAPDRYYIIGGN